MKKIFTLLVAFLALTFCAKAQVTIILEAHDVWGDGSGYQLLLDADHNTYGTIIPETGGLTSSGDAPASVYAEFEYKVPVGADGSLTTTNMVYDGTATITIPAGTYDFCITNPTPNDRMWIAGGGIDPTRADDYVFVDGSTYHFLMLMNGQNDACQLTVTMNPTSPTIIASPTAVDFGNVLLGNTATSTITVNNYLLTAPVTATVTAPFEISTDGTTFGTTASIPTTGGTLTVRYAPTTVGTDNGTITLSSAGATDVTITLTGSGLDCSNITVPFTEGFESTIDCWTMVSMDPANDDRFGIYADPSAYEGDYDFRFSSFSTASDYNQWLITPELTLNANETYLVKFFYQGYNANENFKVMYSTTNNNPTSFTMLADYTNVATSWTEVVLELPTGTKYVAIDYYGNYQYYLYVDNFSIITSTPSMSLNETALDFGINEMGSTSDAQYVVMSTININEPFTVATTAPFEVSLDGATFATTQTIPANTSMVVNDTIFVRFAPTAAGTFNGNLTVTSTNYNGTVALSGESVDCTPGITVPYTQDFNSALVPPVCWSIGYDPEIFMTLQVDETDYCIGMEGVDMLITPEIHTTDPIMVAFDYINYGGTSATAPTYFHVGYSTTDNDPSSFTWQGDQLCSTDEFESYSTIVPAGTKYLAIGTSQIGTFLYYGIFEMEDIFVIDNLSLTAQTEPLLNVSPESMSFGSIIAGAPSTAKTASVVGALLTSNINVTAPANFEVSSNGTSFAATATLPQDGGMLYVRYNPSAPGNHNGNVTLTSGSTTRTIAVSGSAIDCSAPITLPYNEDFESEGTLACWTFVDADGDGYNWDPTFLRDMVDDETGEGYCHNGSYGMISSASYINNVGALTPDNWLISPGITIPANYTTATLSWYAKGQDAGYAEEYYAVYVSTNGANIGNFNTTLYEGETTGDWIQHTANLSAYAGQTIRIAFRHYNVTDMFWLDLDDISVTGTVGVEDHELSASIYPNPANNVLNINANCNINNVAVYNMMGQMVASYNVNDMNTQISTVNLANGVYTVKISTENGMSTQRFTVVR